MFEFILQLSLGIFRNTDQIDADRIKRHHSVRDARSFDDPENVQKSGDRQNAERQLENEFKHQRLTSLMALDAIGINLIGITALVSILLNTSAFLEVILLIGILAFIGTVDKNEDSNDQFSGCDHFQ